MTDEPQQWDDPVNELNVSCPWCLSSGLQWCKHPHLAQSPSGVGQQSLHEAPQETMLLSALKRLYALVPDCDGDYLLDGNKGEFALKSIRVPGIGEACQNARAAIEQAERPRAAAPEAGIAAILNQLVEKWRASRAHTYSSENADLYRGFDNGCRRCADELEAVLLGGRPFEQVAQLRSEQAELTRTLNTNAAAPVVLAEQLRVAEERIAKAHVVYEHIHAHWKSAEAQRDQLRGRLIDVANALRAEGYTAWADALLEPAQP